MTFDTDRFRRIRDVIRNDPQRLDMCSWESVCGTTRCVAGWAVWDEVGGPLYSPYGTLSSEVRALALELGVEPEIPDIAAHLLGLGEGQLALFLIGDDAALRFVELAAEGLDNNARQILFEELRLDG